MIAPQRMTKSSSTRGRLADEADAARFLGAELDIGDSGGRDDVEAALVIGELQHAAARQRGLHLPGELLGRQRRLEAELAGGVDDSDADLHVGAFRVLPAGVSSDYGTRLAALGRVL